MPSNILTAITNIINDPITTIKSHYAVRNKVNSMGTALEEYVKDIFAGTVQETDESTRLKVLEKTFSYIGNQNNPPDAIIRNGDAIEVKKIENRNSSIALNSSYPKAKISADSYMVTDACRKCEDWKTKDILYIVGVIPKENGKEGKYLTNLSFVYGTDYAATAQVYEKIKHTIGNGINTIPDVEFAETNELGRVNRVDPLGITYLRIRGMWGIENPLKTFSYVYSSTTSHQFELMAIINIEKYNSFPIEDRVLLEQTLNNNPNSKIIDVKIKNPDNPSKLLNAKLVTFWR